MMRIRRGIAAALAGTAFILAGCRDQGPEAGAVPELYVLESIAGQPLPLRLSDPGSDGAFVTIHGGRIKLTFESEDGETSSRPRLRLETTAEIVRREGRTEKVVAHGESSETYFYERDEDAIIPYRIENGDRVDAPFFLEIQGQALVMHSDQEALRNWRFIR